MKQLVEKFLSKKDRARIEAVVSEAEKKTAGEIVCMVVPSSYHYPTADILGACATTLPLSIVGTYVIGGRLWLGTQNMWLFMGLFAIGFILFHWLVRRLPAFKRQFVSRREIDEEVEEAAINGFFRQGLYRTRDANGVLLFISVFEHKVWLLADKGIHEKVPSNEWDDLVGRITKGIRKGKGADAICDAIGHIGDLLQAHFPIKPDDTDELANLIIEGE